MNPPVSDTTITAAETGLSAALKIRSVPSSANLGRRLGGESERRLKSRAARAEARLDLHGMTEAAAHAALRIFIEEASAANLHIVLVITGKGRMGQGILRRNLPLWLEASELSTRIAAVQPAFHHDGGDGALYVKLRRR